MKRSRVSWVLGTLIVFALTLTVQAGKKDKGLTLLEKLQGHINHTQNGLPAGIKKALSTNQDFPIENDSDRYILCARDEDQYTGMEREIIAPWERAWKKGDFGSFQKLLSKSYKIPRFARPEKVSRSNMGAISEFGWLTSKDRLTTKRQLINQYKKDWKQYKEIIDFSLDTETYLSKRGQRFAPGFLEMKEADLLVRFDLRAIDMKNQRRNDRGTMRVRLIRKNIQSPWKISTYQILKGETLVSTKPSFINTTTASIGNNVPIYKREEAIRRGGYALAISDYDGDGIQDMYVGAAEKGTLLRGLGNGKFAKANIPAIENYSLVKAAVWGDYFNTGRQDLLLVRFTPNESAAKKSDVVMFENLGGGKFKERKGWFKIKNNSDYAMPVAVADLNGDKLLDFYIGYPGAKDFTILGESHYDNKKLQVQGLFLNQGKGKFKDFSREALGESAFQRIYPHSAMSVDYDQDGDMDLVVIDDRGNLSPVYKNDGHGKFTQTADEIGVGNKDWGMGIAAGDINNDGRLDFAMTNVNFMAAKRINKSCIHNWEHDNFSKLGHQGLRTFGQTGNGKFVETTKANGLEWMGEGAAGVEFMDYNNDGHLDIYVVNGLWSGDKQRKEQDLSSLFVRASGLNLLEEDLHALHGKKKVHAPAKDSYWDYLQYRSKSQSAVMLTLSNFKGDIHQGGKDSYRPSLAGFQRNRLFRNNGNGSFTEVGFLEGVDSIKDGYIISQTDLNKDGKMDFVLRNCDPGTRENWFSPVEVFINNNNEKKKSLTLNLEGRASNRDAIGSFVTGVVQGRKFIRHLIANNGTAQSEKILHIGMGNAKVIDRLTVHWPSGTVQNFKNVKAGHLKIVEGNDLERMANK